MTDLNTELRWARECYVIVEKEENNEESHEMIECMKSVIPQMYQHRFCNLSTEQLAEYIVRLEQDIESCEQIKRQGRNPPSLQNKINELKKTS